MCQCRPRRKAEMESGWEWGECYFWKAGASIYAAQQVQLFLLLFTLCLISTGATTAPSQGFDRAWLIRWNSEFLSAEAFWGPWSETCLRLCVPSYVIPLLIDHFLFFDMRWWNGSFLRDLLIGISSFNSLNFRSFLLPCSLTIFTLNAYLLKLFTVFSYQHHPNV